MIAISHQIRKLLEDKNHHWADKEIIAELDLNWRTYYRYKARIVLEDKDLWQKIRTVSLERGALDILQTLDRCYETCAKIRDDPKSSAKSRMEAGQIAIDTKVQIYYLLAEGPNPKLREITKGLQPPYPFGL